MRTPVVHSTRYLGLRNTGEGRASGKSQKSNRLEHFEKLKGLFLENELRSNE